ncbi:TPA: hypothetical protein HA241_06365 [Candidatus Woesearchaeota archaeon]|nr:hypothetical protein [Candidatus Woesearchaeota archaeon]
MVRIYFVVQLGMEEIAVQEFQELCSCTAISVHAGLIVGDITPEQVLLVLQRMQSPQRILLAIAEPTNTVETIAFDDRLKLYFYPQCRIKVEVENVRGQEVRSRIARNVAGKLISAVENVCGFEPVVEMKKPTIIVYAVCVEGTYYVGVDAAGFELHARRYRLFPSAASFKGDFGYYFVRASGFQRGEKLLVGFVKDGTLAIEAALLANGVPLYPQSTAFSYLSFPLFQGVQCALERLPSSTTVYAFDSSSPAVVAARRNVSLAGLKSLVDVKRCLLDELEVVYLSASFDRIIFYVSKKDEELINEIYYQASTLLKEGGFLLLLRCGSSDTVEPASFTVISNGVISRGDSVYSWRLFQKKVKPHLL